MDDKNIERMLGSLEQFVEQQQTINSRTDEFLTNHWPHMVADIAGLKMTMKIIAGSVILGVGALVPIAISLWI